MAKQKDWCAAFFSGLYGDVLANGFPEVVSAAQARMIRRVLHLRKGQRVLDLPCGQGRISISLARLGLNVTGVDLIPSYVRKARRDARAADVDVRFVQGDMRAVDFDGEFHGCACWFGSFGYFSDDENLDVARRVHRALRPGGRFLVDGVSKSWITSHFREHDVAAIGGVRVEQHGRWDADGERLLSAYDMTKGRRRERHTIAMRIYSAADMRQLLRAAGFREITFYDGAGLGRVTRATRRMLAVARKEGC